MSVMKINDNSLYAIADSIRAKLGVDTTYLPSEMAAAIDGITGGVTSEDNGKVVVNGQLVAQTSLSVDENGTYDTTTNDSVTVSVPDSGGTVTPLSVTENGTYNPPSGVDGYAPVTVNVTASGGNTHTGTGAPPSSLGVDGDLYLRSIPVNTSVTFLDYIKSSGTQYIDTGINLTEKIDVRVTLRHSTSSDDASFGCRLGSWGGMTNVLYINDTNSQKCTIWKSNTSVAGDTSFGPSLADNELYTAETKTFATNSGYCFVADVNTKNIMGKTGQSSFTSAYTMLMFAANLAGSVSKARSTMIRRAVIFSEGSPIADYMAALDGDGMACMWENISGQFVYNDGTGDFIAGSTLGSQPEPLETIKYQKVGGVWKVIRQW